MLTMEQLVQELDKHQFNNKSLYQGIMTKDTWYGWRKRGLPKQVKKYMELLNRLEELKNPPKPKQSEWAASDNH